MTGLPAVAIVAVVLAVAASPAGAGPLDRKVEQARKQNDRAVQRLADLGTGLDGVNGAIISVDGQIDADRATLAEQSSTAASLEQTVTLSSDAVEAVDAQLASRDDAALARPGGDDGYLFDLNAIDDLQVRRVVASAIATGGNVESTLQSWQAGANAQVDNQLDLYRSVLWDVHNAQASRAKLIRRQRRLLARLSDARQTQVETSLALTEFSMKLSGVSPALPAVPVPGTTGRGSLYVCPVDPPRVVSDDFGDPRYGGGFHLHAGNDILSPAGTAIRAPFDGVAVDATNTLGGLAVRVTGADGYVYNAHMERIETLGRVRAGDIIGYVGNTGDAAGGPTHDHFEWHPNDTAGAQTINGAVDPHPALMAVCAS